MVWRGKHSVYSLSKVKLLAKSDLLKTLVNELENDIPIKNFDYGVLYLNDDLQEQLKIIDPVENI